MEFKTVMHKWNLTILVIQILILLVALFWFSPQFSINFNVGNQNNDAIAVAAQIGRLDVVSLIFALFGIILALFAFGGFFSIRAYAKNIATEVATEVASNVASQNVDNLKSSITKSASDKIDTKSDKIDTINDKPITGEDQ